MKITIKLTPEQLNAMLLLVSELPMQRGNTPEARAVQSIFDEVYNKLLKKQIDKRNEPQNKPFSLSLKYYEAYALSEVLSKAQMLIGGEYFYEKNAVLILKNKILEQL